VPTGSPTVLGRDDASRSRWCTQYLRATWLSHLRGQKSFHGFAQCLLVSGFHEEIVNSQLLAKRFRLPVGNVLSRPELVPYLILAQNDARGENSHTLLFPYISDQIMATASLASRLL
jgi:hypothetical protein